MIWFYRFSVTLRVLVVRPRMSEREEAVWMTLFLFLCFTGTHFDEPAIPESQITMKECISGTASTVLS